MNKNLFSFREHSVIFMYEALIQAQKHKNISQDHISRVGDVLVLLKRGWSRMNTFDVFLDLFTDSRLICSAFEYPSTLESAHASSPR